MGPPDSLDRLADALEIVSKSSDRTFPWQDANVTDFMDVTIAKGGYLLRVRVSAVKNGITREVGIFRTIDEAFDAAVRAWEPYYLKHIEKCLRGEHEVEEAARDVMEEFRGMPVNETLKVALKKKLVERLQAVAPYTEDEIELTVNPITGEYGVSVTVGRMGGRR
jgi:hypothetical protein